MKNMAMACVVIAALTLLGALSIRMFNMSPIMSFGHKGLMKATMTLLLFGINFGLLELLNKK